MKRSAFTILELIFVIVVIGILAVMAMPSFNNNPLRDAAEQVAEHIRYTQHLAMVDDKYDPNDSRWYIEQWQLEFKPLMGDIYYEIYSDQNHQGNSDNNESALDPLTRQSLDQNSEITNLTKRFGVTGVTFSNSCHATTSTAIGELAFDTMGRPYYYITGNTSDTGKPTPANMFAFLLKSDCTITLTGETGHAVITVRPETGYVSVSY